MFLSGYHGTTLKNANNIISEGAFHISDSDVEWLGSGIYFYFDISDAYNWRESESIFHVVTKIDDEEYLDIDSPEGTKIYTEMIKYISSMQEKSEWAARSVQQNQCAVMKMLWDAYPSIKVMSASFAKEHTLIKTLIDKRSRRREFCVRNNSYIKHIHLIRRSELDD